MSLAGCDPAPALTGTPEAGSSGSVFVYDELTKGIARRLVAQVQIFVLVRVSLSLSLSLARALSLSLSTHTHTHTHTHNAI